MPRLLKKDAIRLAEASIESLALAQVGVSSFHRIDHRENIVRFAPETGLIGTSIEMIMSSILIQAFDKSVVIKTGTRYKTAAEILSDFRNLLRQRPASLGFLTNGIDNKSAHLDQILNLTSRFRIIITSRASAFHNGVGLNFDVISALFQEVSLFISLISKSSNYKPYITHIPRMIVLNKEKSLVIEEIYHQIRQNTSIENQQANIASLFLLLPEIPQNLPQWIDEYESFNIAPKENDIVNLIDSLEQANPITIRRIRGGANTQPVRIDNNNPNAIPVQAQFLRGQFTQFKDQFFADSATANGRLANNQLDLPPTTSVCRCFCIGLTKLSVLNDERTSLTAHEAWPTIAAALRVPSNGITFPVWNIVRKTNDLRQLRAILLRTRQFGNRPFGNNIDNFIQGLNCIINDNNLDKQNQFYSNSFSEYNKLNAKYNQFNLQSAKASYNLSVSHKNLADQFEDGSINLEQLGKSIIDDQDLPIQTRRYWMTKVSEASNELDVLPFLFRIYENKDFAVCKTQIKKCMRALDLVSFGPSIEQN